MKPLLILLAFTTAALAQQPTPSQVAGQINTVVIQWAQTIEAQQAQIAKLQARVKELEDKYEPKPSDKKD
jgi:cell division protein FtsB